MAVVENAAYTTRDKRLALDESRSSLKASGPEAASSVHALRGAFEQMKALRGLVIAEQERRRIATAVLADPSAMATIRAVLEEQGSATRLFAQEQAEARYYAVEIVREACRQGQPELAAHLASQVLRELNNGTSVEPGRFLDLEGLVSAFAEGVGVQSVETIQRELTRWGDRSTWAPEAVGAVTRGLLDGLWRASDIDTAHRLVSGLLDA